MTGNDSNPDPIADFKPSGERAMKRSLQIGEPQGSRTSIASIRLQSPTIPKTRQNSLAEFHGPPYGSLRVTRAPLLLDQPKRALDAKSTVALDMPNRHEAPTLHVRRGVARHRPRSADT
jgi:hypothetical protein